jgi:hypothetical protein
MWERQSQRAGVHIAFQSFESLSRKNRPVASFDLVIIDEAHHARNSSTVRYRELSRMLTTSKALMLTATPIHNTRRDITALLSLFLGSRAESLNESDFSRCVIRRSAGSIEHTPRFPEVTELQWKEIPDGSDIPNQLLALPPPVPLRDGGLGAVLIRRALLRQWCSSDGALEAALRRRLARSIALAAALESGQYPTQAELRAWTFAEDSLQLAFPSLVAASGTSCADLLAGVRAHERALRTVLAGLATDTSRDIERAHILKEIRIAHRYVPIVAFTQYAATVAGMFRILRTEHGVAALTASGARVAGGTISRREALNSFAPIASGAKAPREIECISLLLTTDLMSEGVNLQDAGVVVHLDLPWTAARLEQRLGRIRRMESSHSVVHSYGIRPIGSAEMMIRLEATVRRKLRETESMVGRSINLLPDEQATSRPDPLAISEQMRATVSQWLRTTDETQLSHRPIQVAGVSSKRSGFIALTRAGSHTALVAYDGSRITESPRTLLDLLGAVGRMTRQVPSEAFRSAIGLVERWMLERRILGFTAADQAAVARARHRILRRIASITQCARPHQRQRINSLADSARQAVLGRLGVAAESEMMQLASSPLDDDVWLESISQIFSERDGTGEIESTVIALLILVPDDDARISARR